MDRTDALGRRRAPAQERGLRPLHPLLPAGVTSRSLRVAMSARAWEALGRLIDVSDAPTKPRALGQILERALGAGPATDWQDWQIRKEKQLLERLAS